MEAVARAARDPLIGPLKLGVDSDGGALPACR